MGAVEEKPKKKKGRPPKNQSASAAVSAAASVSAIDDFESGNGKRKRVGKPMSVTPSVVDEDMDDDKRENVGHFPLLS